MTGCRSLAWPKQTQPHSPSSSHVVVTEKFVNASGRLRRALYSMASGIPRRRICGIYFHSGPIVIPAGPSQLRGSWLALRVSARNYAGQATNMVLKEPQATISQAPELTQTRQHEKQNQPPTTNKKKKAPKRGLLRSGDNSDKDALREDELELRYQEQLALAAKVPFADPWAGPTQSLG